MPRIIAVALSAVLFAAPLHAQTASIIGLIGKSLTAEQKASGILAEATKSQSNYFPDIQEAFEGILKIHLQAAKDLRAAFALSNTPPGFDPTQPVAGLSAGAVSRLDPNGFYYAAVHEHRVLNDRLNQVLETWTQNLFASDYQKYKDLLNQAEALVNYARRTDPDPGI